MGATSGNYQPSVNVITEILAGCFYQADTLYVKGISIPLLGTGAGEFSKDLCLDTMVKQIAKRLFQGLTEVEEVRIVLAGPAEILKTF